MELWRGILVHVAVDDMPALQALTLTCKYLYGEAEKLLYREVDFDDHLKINSFCAAVTSRHARFFAVRRLRLVIKLSWIPAAHPSNIRTILSGLVNLDVLSLSITGGDSRESTALLQVITDACKSTRLRELHYSSTLAEGGPELVELLASQPSLEELFILGQTDATVDRDILPRLRILRGSSPYVRFNVPPSALTHLNFVYTVPEYGSFEHDLALFTPQLISLRVTRTFRVGSTNFWPTAVFNVVLRAPFLRHFEFRQRPTFAFEHALTVSASHAVIPVLVLC